MAIYFTAIIMVLGWLGNLFFYLVYDISTLFVENDYQWGRIFYPIHITGNVIITFGLSLLFFYKMRHWQEKLARHFSVFGGPLGLLGILGFVCFIDCLQHVYPSNPNSYILPTDRDSYDRYFRCLQAFCFVFPPFLWFFWCDRFPRRLLNLVWIGLSWIALSTLQVGTRTLFFYLINSLRSRSMYFGVIHSESTSEYPLVEYLLKCLGYSALQFTVFVVVAALLFGAYVWITRPRYQLSA